MVPRLNVCALPDNVRALRPIRILLATDDDAFAGGLATAARDRTIELATIPIEADPDPAAVGHAANTFVLDAGAGLRRAARSATSFAACHPEIAVVLVGAEATRSSLCGLCLLDRRAEPALLLREIELAYLRLRPSCRRSTA